MMNLEFKNKNKVFINPPIQVIYEEILKKREGVIGKSGAMMIDTGEFTGRSPNDKYFVEESFSKDNLVNIKGTIGPATKLCPIFFKKFQIE